MPFQPGKCGNPYGPGKHKPNENLEEVILQLIASMDVTKSDGRGNYVTYQLLSEFDFDDLENDETGEAAVLERVP